MLENYQNAKFKLIYDNWINWILGEKIFQSD